MRERDPQDWKATLHYMAMSCVFGTNGDPGWSLEELRLQDYWERQHPSSGVSAGPTRGDGKLNSNHIKPSAFIIIGKSQNIVSQFLNG